MVILLKFKLILQKWPLYRFLGHPRGSLHKRGGTTGQNQFEFNLA